MKITIDSIPVEVNNGATVMDAAALLGIEIPSMCYLPGHANHPTCMVCLVKDEDTGKLFPSCAMPVSEGMRVITSSADVIEARKEALELLLSDHVGDCEAPCRRSCPAFMDIPLMNRLIAAGAFNAAMKVVREEIALPLVLGYICPAPCEKACHRAPIGGAVSICLLKRFTAQSQHTSPLLLQERGLGGEVNLLSGVSGEEDQVRKSGSQEIKSKKKIAIIGTGPAGLSAAFYLLRYGYQCVLFDKNEFPGGALRYSIPDGHLPKDALDKDIRVIREMGAVFQMNRRITKEVFEDTLLPGFDAVVLATGNRLLQPSEDFGFETGEDSWITDKRTHATSRPGIFVCGDIIREQKMAVHSAAQGKTAAMAVNHYLSGKDILDGKHRFHSVISHLFPAEREEYLKESAPGNRIEPAGGFLPGFTGEEAIREAKRCLRCDCRKPVSCKLRYYSNAYHTDRRRFAGHERKHLTRSVQHETVIYEPEKCIKCGLCVEISKKEESALGMTFIGRGFDVRIGVPFTETIKQGLDKTADACVSACPTGALSFRKAEERFENPDH
jgi:NADPH-dependent glutamate synthase beta subunit-like oxidoreductase